MVSSTASVSDPWRVGVLFSRTGLTSVTETEHFLGTALAIREINQAGGILGREIEVVAYDRAAGVPSCVGAGGRIPVGDSWR
jgi:branched-chain amino acid transport system substrate-binding protein